MPGPPLASLSTAGALPTLVDVVVIGGGIIGVCTALELAERGQRVALLEKGEIAGEQSSRNWGWVRLSRRDERELELVIASQKMWQEMDHRIDAATGYVQSGIAFTCNTEAERERQERWLKLAEPYQLQARLLGAQELLQHFPGATLTADTALYSAEDGYAEPQMAVTAMAQACQTRGVHVHTGCAARIIETSAGSVSAVVTEQGRINCQAVVLAGGAWSSLFCRNLGLDLPQLNVLSTALRTSSIPSKLIPALWTSDFAMRQRQDGGLTVASGHRSVFEITPDAFRYGRQFLPALRNEWKSLTLRVGTRSLTEWRRSGSWDGSAASPFEQERVLDPAPAAHLATAAMDRARECFPQLAKVSISQIWAGLIDVTPDAIPVISGVESLPGFYIGTGFSGHGFGVGPGAACLMADLVCGTKPLVDPAPFRFSRFSDGSRIVIDSV